MNSLAPYKNARETARKRIDDEAKEFMDAIDEKLVGIDTRIEERKRNRLEHVSAVTEQRHRRNLMLELKHSDIKNRFHDAEDKRHSEAADKEKRKHRQLKKAHKESMDYFNEFLQAHEDRRG